jgi:glutathione S-transferase
MLKLYWAPDTGVIAPEVMCEEMGLACERIPVDMAGGEHLGAAFRQINPACQVPTIILEDGTVVTESAAMVLLLGERDPRGALAPAPGAAERPVFLRWLMFLATSVYGAFMGVHHSDRFIGDPAHYADVRATALERLDDHFSIVEAAIAGDPWFLESGYSALDIYLAMLVGWHPEPGRILEQNPALHRLCDAIERRDAFARVMARHRDM